MTKEDIYKPLLEELQQYLSKPTHLDFIWSAFLYAFDKHDGQKRKSGEPYIVHPRDVAITLAEYRVDPNTIVSGLLHDVIEDTDATYNDVLKATNKDIADIVKSLTNDRDVRTEEGRDPYMINKLRSLTALELNVKLLDRLDNIQDFNSAPPYFIERYGTATRNIINAISQGPNVNRMSQLIMSEIMIVINKYLN